MRKRCQELEQRLIDSEHRNKQLAEEHALAIHQIREEKAGKIRELEENINAHAER